MVVEISVTLKEGVLDPQAKAIDHALKSLGFLDIKNVSLGKKIILEFDHHNKQQALLEAQKMSEELLANTVIEDYFIHVREK
ncbi:phosphoribosylformylglycinamidine synthase subunit PurS [Helicobacter sp. 11S03491-1]|uniref:phosphoribosylformylglycinamidine synthase subunit PurS n=1 Tax=Helicobacter sp. 11S03491-1 TaxID=1476196 RepID=UPI000BA72C1A|nr:phosphoribosylformylglycinamidine synthase subunit PurS [Helicobacter sp. 11S03491-1]PAF41686.1 phosphoribosylformylglycinamidine synthase, purS protein [Helicobacter sp. 11S03491-1]